MCTCSTVLCRRYHVTGWAVVSLSQSTGKLLYYQIFAVLWSDNNNCTCTWIESWRCKIPIHVTQFPLLCFCFCLFGRIVYLHLISGLFLNLSYGLRQNGPNDVFVYKMWIQNRVNQFDLAHWKHNSHSHFDRNRFTQLLVCLNVYWKIIQYFPSIYAKHPLMNVNEKSNEIVFLFRLLKRWVFFSYVIIRLNISFRCERWW